MPATLTACVEHWPIARAFTIARGTKTQAVVVVVELSDGPFRGRGECVPYARYGETVETVLHAISSMREALAEDMDRRELQSLMPPGAARNAIDCALWDLEAKRSGTPVHLLAGLPAPGPRPTAYTISLGTPDAMAAATREAVDHKVLKIKLGGDHGDRDRLQAVRHAAPGVELIVDANEGWTVDNFADNLAICAQNRVSLVEQPLPADNDAALASIRRPVPVCADESVHDRATLDGLSGKYDAINIKLDKTGGLTEALQLATDAKQRGFELMVGCMVATSLSMAPALLLAQQSRFVDLDGPLLLAADRPHALRYDRGVVYPPEPALWG